MKHKYSLANTAFIAMILLFLGACKKDIDDSKNDIQVLAPFKTLSTDPAALTFYALKNGAVLDKYSTSKLDDALSSISITGMANVKILAIDFRPKTGQLFGLGNNNRVYIIDASTGSATLTPELFTTADKMPPIDASTPRIPVTVNGTLFGFDFNPVADRLRVVSNTGQSLRINVETGFTIIDGSINPLPAIITAVAYDDNDNDAATATELYAIDEQSQKLFEVDPPNNGTLVQKGLINFALKGDGGFDIAPKSAMVTTDIGLGIYQIDAKSTLFRMDVETGVTTLLAKYGTDLMYTGFAISPL